MSTSTVELYQMPFSGFSLKVFIVMQLFNSLIFKKLNNNEQIVDTFIYLFMRMVFLQFLIILLHILI